MPGLCEVCAPGYHDKDSGLYGYRGTDPDADVSSVLSCAEPTPPPTPCRDVLKWVQALDLTFALKHARRDCANGFLIGEMLSRYFPQDITMHSFVNGTSSATRHSNWALVQKACRKNDFQLPPDLVAGCVAERVGAANALLEVLFEHLTQRQIRRPEEIPQDVLKAAQDKAAADHAEEEAFAGAEGATAISHNAKPIADLKFGSIKQRNLEDAVALRQKLAAGA